MPCNRIAALRQNFVITLNNYLSRVHCITFDALSSLPMQVLWQGMSDPRISWDSSQHHIDWEEFDQVSGGIFSLDSRLLASYAIVSREYLHLNIRFGYHFSIVDAICGAQSNTNYLNFRFKGGGAAHQQKVFRLHFIDQFLTSFGFETSMRGDMLDASFARAPLAETKLALTHLGMLLAATRLMDVRLTSKRQVAEEAEKFLLLAEKDGKFKNIQNVIEIFMTILPSKKLTVTNICAVITQEFTCFMISHTINKIVLGDRSCIPFS